MIFPHNIHNNLHTYDNFCCVSFNHRFGKAVWLKFLMRFAKKKVFPLATLHVHESCYKDKTTLLYKGSRWMLNFLQSINQQRIMFYQYLSFSVEWSSLWSKFIYYIVLTIIKWNGNAPFLGCLFKQTCTYTLHVLSQWLSIFQGFGETKQMFTKKLSLLFKNPVTRGRPSTSYWRGCLTINNESHTCIFM